MMKPSSRLAALASAIALTGAIGVLAQQEPARSPARRQGAAQSGGDESGPGATPYVPDADYLRWPFVPSAQAYAPINGDRLKGYVKEITAISRRYRDKGHQYWGRIAGTDADAENAEWMAAKFRAAGLTNVRIQPLDLPPQWMPQSWSVVVSGAGKSVKLEAVTPEQRLSAALSGTRDLEVVYVGWGTEADFAGRDVKGKAAFIYSMPMPGIRTTSATRNGAASRAIARGAAAVFNVVEMPGNVTGMWSITSGADRDKVPAFFVGSRDGAAVRDMIEAAGSTAQIRTPFIFSFKTSPTPVMVPPVPTPATKASMRLNCLSSSTAVVWRCTSGFAGLLNCCGMK